MKAVAHKVKIYRRTFPSIPAGIFRSRIFVLVSVGIILLISSLAIHTYAAFWRDALIPRPTAWLILGSELLLMLGFLQLFLEIEQAHFEHIRGVTAPNSFRATIAQVQLERRNTIEALFDSKSDLIILAKSLVKEWEWRHYVYSRSDDPTHVHIGKFLRLPHGSTLATYLTALFAVCLALVAITIEREHFFEYLPTYWINFKALTLLAAKLALPTTVIFIAVAMMVKTTRLLLRNIRQHLDDDYLDAPAFYEFIRELIELEDGQQRRLLSTTSSWTIRLLMTPFSEWGRWGKTHARAKNFAAIRAHRRNKP